MSGFANVESLGIIRDADEDNDAAFKSVCTGLRLAGLPEPPRPLDVTGGKPRISVFIMPDCQRPGRLETLCLLAVAEDPAMPCVKEYWGCLERALPQGNRDVPRNREKAHLQAFLASRQKPGLRLGEAGEAGYWPFDHGAFQLVKDFLLAL